ncbi:MAG: HTH domain-containing protein [Candidatus Moranbacteria bacterium]|nr:HTH domain-containing protein [Candidatus Moranbacteria bacterium]
MPLFLVYYFMKNKSIIKKNSEISLFENAVKSVTGGINERAKAMISDRFGFYGKRIKTLGQIGQDYGITRERVRQIIQEATSKAKKSSKKDPFFKKAEEKIKFTIEKKYGIINKSDLIDSFFKGEDGGNFLDFILYCSDKFDMFGDKENMKESVALAGFKREEWDKIIGETRKILEEKRRVLSFKGIFNEFRKLYPDFEKEKLASYLTVSKEIKKGVFGKWGMADWKEINPKGMRQKAYLVIKESKKPLHFREVARMIDEYKLNKKKTHPQTVHNELIKDENFVLVGRGTYALKEWGYQKGTVKDVIEGILKVSKKPVSQDEIIEKVLSVRNVKEATVIINLNNFFKKMDKRKYFLKKNEVKDRV